MEEFLKTGIPGEFRMYLDTTDPLPLFLSLGGLENQPQYEERQS